MGLKSSSAMRIFWHSIEDRVQAASGGWMHPRFWWRIISVYSRLVRKFLRVQDFDVLIVGYPGQFDIYLAWLFAKMRRKPLVWDVFMSIYLIAIERGLNLRSGLSIRMVRFVERIGLHLPDRLIQDTHEYVAWFERTYGIEPDRFCLVPTGANDDLFKPGRAKPDRSGFHVVYYGTYIPNHGAATMIEAASILGESSRIHFTFIGDGPERQSIQNKAREYRLTNIAFIEWMDQSDLVNFVTQADACLGAFGTTPQSMMTVQNKIYEALAMGMPLITGNSSAVRQEFEHRTHLYLVNRSDPESLAEAILELRDNRDLCQTMSRMGRNLFLEKYSVKALGRQYKNHLIEMFYSKATIPGA